MCYNAIDMIRFLLLAAALLPGVASAQAPAPAARDSRGLWLDWRSLNGANLAAEARREANARRSAAEARTLGDRVGQLVAAGDCEGGERMAREAGDFPLVDAVREYCRGHPATAS